MNELLHLFIFLIILFLYIHITSQYKRSEDLEIYEMDYTTNSHLQEVCDVKQPVLFGYEEVSPEFIDSLNMDLLLKNGAKDVKLKESNDYYNENIEAVEYVVLSFVSSSQLMSTDEKAAYFIENNEDFISESEVYSLFQSNDSILKPSFTAQTKYDLLSGSKNAFTPLRYHTGYRKFYCVTSGKITVKMTPWKSHKYLYTVKDYDNYEFRSPINVWKTQEKYLHEMDKISFLEFDVKKGSILYIPPYWWYSIKFSAEKTIVCDFTYNSFMNCASNIPSYVLYFMQQQNTKTTSTKVLEKELDEPIDLPSNNNENKTTDVEEEKSELQKSIDIITA